MADMRIELPTSKASIEDIRPHLDAAIRENFPGGMLRSHWEGEVLHIDGPGARGTVTLDRGRLIGQATLRPPASLLRPVIEKMMTELLSKAAS